MPKPVDKAPKDISSVSDLEILRLLAFGSEEERRLAQREFDNRFRPFLERYYRRSGIGSRRNSLRDEIVTAGIGDPKSAVNSFLDFLLTGGREWLSMQDESRYELSTKETEKGKSSSVVPMSKVLEGLARGAGSGKAYLGRAFRRYLLGIIDKLRRRARYHGLYEDRQAPENGQAETSAEEVIPADGSAFDAGPELPDSLDLDPEQSADWVSVLLMADEALREIADGGDTYPAETAGIIADFLLKVEQAEESLDPSNVLLELSRSQRLAYWAAIEIGANPDDPKVMEKLAKLAPEILLDEVIAAHYSIDISEVRGKGRKLIQKRRETALKTVQGTLKRPEEQYRLSQKAERSRREHNASHSSESDGPAGRSSGDTSHPPMSNPGLA